MTFHPTKAYNELPELPPQADIESKVILKQSIEARQALANLNASIQKLPNPDVLIAPFILQEARDSSAIENIVTTDDELFKQSDHTAAPSDPAVKEALRYRAALYDAYDRLNARPIGANTAIQICRTLTGVEMDIRAVPGTTLRNDQTGETVYTPPIGQDLIRAKLSNWEKFIHQQTDIDVLIRIAVQHYQFEAIHPFGDGNGRTGRILNVLLLLENRLLDKPVLYLSREILATRDAYYQGLINVTKHDAWETWISYFLKRLTISAEKTAYKAKQIQVLFDSTRTHVRAGAPKFYSQELLDFLFARPYCRIGELVDVGIAKRQTAAVYLGHLAELGVLKETKSGREKIFVHTKLLELLTTDGANVTKYPDGSGKPSGLLDDVAPKKQRPTARTA